MFFIFLSLAHQARKENLDQLILKVAQGDVKAYEELYLQTKSSVYGYALSLVRSPQEAEDIMQDCFLRIYRNAPSFKKENKAINWIMTITRNLSLDRLKSKSSQELSLEEDWLDPGDDFSQQSLDKLALDLAIKSLNQEERQIVILYAVVGFKHREIADFLDLPLTTELSKYHRSLKKLRKKLEEISV